MIRSRARYNDAGFSLIEMIVAVLIIAIAAGAATMSIGAALRANTTRAATELAAVMSEARIQAISRPAGSVELHVYKDNDDGKFYADMILKKTDDAAASSANDQVLESKVIASGAVNMKARKSDDQSGSGIDMTDERKAVITFDKSSGRLHSFEVKTGETVTGSGYDRIEISGAKTSVVKIAQMTGRAYVE